MRSLPLAMLLGTCFFTPYADAYGKDPADAKNISWKKIVVDAQFRAEGVAVADVNKDGKPDILVGEYWYEAPGWKRHETQKPGNYGDGLKSYSHIFACWADDLNGDGFPDLIVIDFPGVPCYWLENPKGQGTIDGKPTHWKKHILWHSACNETPLYTDLLGNGKKVLIMAFQPKGKKPEGNEGQMAYFTPDAKDPTALWEMHPVSEPATAGKVAPGTQRYSHGLGVGDLNGDKKLDVITVGGWWEQPAQPDGKSAWAFHPTSVNDASSNMFAFDVDGDGKNDILHTSAHKYGIWWQKQRPANNAGHPTFEKQDIARDLVSETHAADFVDIDGDGLPDLVTGKRKYSHGLSEPGADKPASLYWLRTARGKDGITAFTPNLIDEDSGVGTQFLVSDFNGDGFPDLIVSNKKGVHLILQVRK